MLILSISAGVMLSTVLGVGDVRLGLFAATIFGLGLLELRAWRGIRRQAEAISIAFREGRDGDLRIVGATVVDGEKEDR